jgi:hypothetical protein
MGLIAWHKAPGGKGNVNGSRRAGWAIHVIQPNGGRSEQSWLTSFSSAQLRCFLSLQFSTFAGANA